MRTRGKWITVGLVLALLTGLTAIVAVTGGGTPAAASTGCPTGTVPLVKLPNLDKTQIGNATTIIQVGQGGRMPAFGLQVAIAVAYQESKLRVLANSTVPESLSLPHQGVGSDHDSVGLFQQRASWGSVAARMDPVLSSGLFYRRLAVLPGWQQMPLTVAAQHIQGSATPSAYAQWESLAAMVVAKITGSLPANSCAPAVGVLPLPGAVGVAVNHALGAVGTSYVFGGTCTDPHSMTPNAHCDCSSLVQQAWKAADVSLPRTSEDQYAAVNLVGGVTAANVAAVAQPGMLIFYNWGEDGRPGPGHVALAIGGGMLVEAPQPGENVHVIPIYRTSFVALGVVKA